MQHDPPDPPGDITTLLSAARRGQSGASAELLPLVYDELRRLARAVFGGQRAGHTLQPTAHVQGAGLKLVGTLGWVENRRHFFRMAGKAMRQVLRDHARGRDAAKRGGDRRRVVMDTEFEAEGGRSQEVDLLALNELLDRLGELNARHAQVVELRVFSGLSIDETAEVLDVSPRTIDSDWSMARAWLRKELAAG